MAGHQAALSPFHAWTIVADNQYGDHDRPTKLPVRRPFSPSRRRLCTFCRRWHRSVEFYFHASQRSLQRFHFRGGDRQASSSTPHAACVPHGLAQFRRVFAQRPGCHPDIPGLWQRMALGPAPCSSGPSCHCFERGVDRHRSGDSMHKVQGHSSNRGQSRASGVLRYTDHVAARAVVCPWTNLGRQS